MPRVYYQDSDDKSDNSHSSFLNTYISFEIITGATLLSVGGFILRANNDYSFVLVGITLLVIGYYRLWSTYNDRGKERGLMEKNRVLRKLKTSLDAEYSIIVDYELPNGDNIPYLILGPPGAVILSLWEHRGDIEETPDGDYWIVTGEDDADKKYPNPIKQNRERVRRLKDYLMQKNETHVPVNHRLIVFSRTASGEPVNTDTAIHFPDLLEELHNLEPADSLDWKEVDDLESVLGLRE